MTKRLHWTVEAAAEFEDHLKYILKRNPRAASRLAERILSVEDMLKDFPTTGSFDDKADAHE